MLAKIIDDKTIHLFDKSQFDWQSIRNSGQIFRDPPCEILDESDNLEKYSEQDFKTMGCGYRALYAIF